METTHCFQASHLHAITRRLFVAAGAPRHIADDVAEMLVNSNLAGYDSHGVFQIPRYMRRIADGAIDPSAEPKVVKESANILVLDGNRGLGIYTARRAMDLAVEKARRADICGVSISPVEHIGRLGEYAKMAVRAGCIGIVTVGRGSKEDANTVPFGGAKGALDTNPIAAGVPTSDNRPFIMDFATSRIAGGKIQVAMSQNADLPEGCIVDKHGSPSVKPADFFDGGFLLPFGGHKGYGLSLFICLLGGLAGNFLVEQGAVDGVFMLVLNVNAFTPLEPYRQAVRNYLDYIKATPPAPGFDEVLVPGDLEHRSRARRLTQGIELPKVIYGQIQEWAGRLNVSLSEVAVEAADVERYRIAYKTDP